MNFFKFVINRKTLISMIFIGLSLLGYVSYTRLPLELIPNVELPYLLVQVSCNRDMNPIYIEKQAVIPLEGAVGTLEGVSKIESTIQQRRGTIYIYYNKNVNINFAYIKLQEKISEQIPSLSDEFSVQVVKIDTERMSNTFMGLQVRGSGGLERVRAIIDKTILKELENIDGISNVQVVGGRVKSVEIVLNNDTAKAYRITPARIRSLISQNAARKTFVGRAYEKNRHYFVNVVADYTDVRELENIIVDTNGPVFLKDIATVTFGEKEQDSISRINGMDAITIQLVRDANVNLIELSHITRGVIDRLNSELKSQDIEIVIQADTSEEMENNINLIKKLAVFGGVLAILILWFFLRNIRLVGIVVLAIPISILTAFNFFYAFDISINSLTLLGMALAVGMLLDNSVVVLENIYRNISLHRDRDTAVIQGTKEVWRSIVASTLTTVMVFLPFVFSSNDLIKVIGRHIGVSIVSTLLVSLVVALSLIPAAAHSLISIIPDTKSFMFTKVSRKYRPVQIYSLFLKSAMRFPARTILIAVVLFFASILICFSLSLDISRELDLTSFNMYVTMPRGSTLERTDAVVTELEAEMDKIEEKQDIISTIYDEEASITVVLMDNYEKLHKRSISQIKSDIKNRVDNFRLADVSLSEPQSSARFGGGSGTNPVASLERMFGIGSQQETIVIKGNDYDMLKEVADDIQYYLEELDTINRTNLNISGNRPEVHIMFDKLIMSRNNVQISSVSSELAGFQNQVSTGISYKQGIDEYDIIISTDEPEKEKTFDDLRTLMIPNQSGATYELNQLSNIIYSYGLSGINRVNQENQIELSYSFIQEVNDSKSYLETSRAEIDELIAAISIPPGVAVEVIHDESEFNEFYFLIGIAILFIYMILASVFESLMTPVVMLFTFPLATIGSLWALIFTGNSLLNANSLMGFLILLGVVVNSGIILIDYTRILRLRGNRRSRALMAAGQARVRPILITTITTIVAMIPLAMGKAEYASRIGTPFAISVIGGLSLSTLFTLVFIPTVYSALESSVAWIKELDWKIKVIQLIALAVCFSAIYYYIDSPLWKGAYVLLSVTGIPGVTWFIMNSLRRAQTEYIKADEPLTITIRRLVKVYDGYSRFVTEWKKGERIEQTFGFAKTYTSWHDFEQITWQLPLLGFLIYFVFIYIRSHLWLFILSNLVYFFALMIWQPFERYLVLRTERTGKHFSRKLAVWINTIILWGLPLFILFLFYIKEFKILTLAFIGFFWYSALTIFTTANYLQKENINIMRLKGRFAGIRLLFFRFVRMIPIIGRKKNPFNALDTVSLTIQSGMFGLLGPNGAGKTTIMRIICGILDKSLGTIKINDIDFTEKREELQGLIGYLPQEFGTYENMTAYEFLDYLAILKGMYDSEKRNKRVEYSLASVHLSEHKNRKIGTFSGGMKQRMGIALTLLHLPRTLVVDEPTAGLDPRERIRFRNLLVELSRERIVIFSTHIIEDISSSCNKVAVLNRGKMYYLGDPVNMTRAAEGKVWQFFVDESQFNEIRHNLRIIHHMRVEDMIRIRCLAETKPFKGAESVMPTLEDAYLWLLGKKEQAAEHPNLINEQ